MEWLLALLAWIGCAALFKILLRLPATGGALLAISRTLLAEVWRRGVIPVGGAVLFAGLAILPLLLEESSTVDARLQTVLDYGQSWISSVLLLLTMLMACGTLSDERVTGRIRLLVVRPGGTWKLLPGKWLGIIGAVLALLVPASLMLTIICNQVTNNHKNIMAVPSVVLVSPESLEVTDEEVQQYISMQIQMNPQGWGGLDEEKALEVARSRLERLYRSLIQRSRTDYRFVVEGGLTSGSQLAIRPALGRVHRSEGARLRLYFGEGNDVVEEEVVIWNGVRSRFDIPDSLVGKEQVSIGMQFFGAVDEGIQLPSLMWSGSDSLRLRIPQGTIFSSLLRGQFLTCIRCGFVAALGLAAATFLGLPVAILLVVSFLIAAGGGGFTGAFESESHSHSHSHEDPRKGEASRVILDVLADGGQWIVSNLGDWNRHVSGSRIAAGERITVSELISGFLSIGLLWGGGSLLLGSWIHARREHGLGADR